MEENVLVIKDGTIWKRMYELLEQVYGEAPKHISALELILAAGMLLFIWLVLGLTVGGIVFGVILGWNSNLGLLFGTAIGMAIVAGGFRLGQWLKNTTVEVE